MRAELWLGLKHRPESGAEKGADEDEDEVEAGDEDPCLNLLHLLLSTEPTNKDILKARLLPPLHVLALHLCVCLSKVPVVLALPLFTFSLLLRTPCRARQPPSVYS